MSERQLREAIAEHGKRLVETGLVQGTWGNLSARLDEQFMLVTPSGLDYLCLAPADIVRVDLFTFAYESSNGRRPTTEKRFHSAIYRARPEVNAVIHTHAEYCGVFAAAHRPLPASTPEQLRLFGGDVRCAAHALPSTARLTRFALAALDGRSACLLANHGAICIGSSLAAAFAVCGAAEAAARTALCGNGDG